MPLFEYECRACKARFEQLVYDRAVEIVCRKCGSKDIVQQLSTFAVSSESSRPAPQPGGCAGCPGMQGGNCPMNQ
jgi:putative FmdB family regulatory protein